MTATMRQLFITPFLACTLFTSAAVCAQEDIGEQYHYFTAQGIADPAKQKALTELLRGYDAGMVVSLDQPTQQLKLKTTVHLDLNDVVHLCQLIGVQLRPIARREGALATE